MYKLILGEREGAKESAQASNFSLVIHSHENTQSGPIFIVFFFCFFAYILYQYHARILQ